MRTKIGDPGCMPFFAKSAIVSLERGTSDGAGIEGVLEQAANSIAAANTADWAAAFHVCETRIRTNASFPELFPRAAEWRTTTNATNSTTTGVGRKPCQLK
jgi:hypothetical protein